MHSPQNALCNAPQAASSSPQLCFLRWWLTNRWIYLRGLGEDCIELLSNTNEARALRKLAQLRGTHICARGPKPTQDITNRLIDGATVWYPDSFAFRRSVFSNASRMFLHGSVTGHSIEHF